MRTLVLVYGRFQGQHQGHEWMVYRAHDIMSELCTEDNPTAAELMIVPTRTYNKLNPIPFDAKLQLMRMAFPKHQHYIRDDQPSSIIDILKNNQEAFDNVIMVVGEDRLEAFDKLLNAYNMIQYEYKSIEVISCGNRSDTGTHRQRASGTRMREAVQMRDYDLFDLYAPTALSHEEVRDMYDQMCVYISEIQDHVS